MKILIVDDDPRIREALVTGLQLQWQDAQVVEANDGEQGVRQFFDANPDIVLLDITMPRMSGFAEGTVSRWVRLAGNEPLLQALQDGRIDLFRAMPLVTVRDPAVSEELIEAASAYAPEAFDEFVRQRVADSDSLVETDERRLALVAERLGRVQTVTPAAVDYLQRIIDTASTLLRSAQPA
jgi:CheY-like chemotaxis protein